MSRPTDYLPADTLAELRRKSDLRGLGSIAWTWGWIMGCLALYVWQPGVLTFLFGFIVISGRHLALAILMHEGAHRLLLNNVRWNDRVTQWLTAYPVMLNMLPYRDMHLRHHKNTWTEDDPDLGLATALPVTRRSFARKMLRDITGQTGYARYRFIARLSAGLSPDKRGLEGRPLSRVLATFARNQHGFLITNALMLAALTAAGRPEAFLLLWWLPAMTGYSVVLRIRNIAEHAVVTDPGEELRQTRTTLTSWWVRFLMAPHNVNYHLEHHLFMSVPQYNLPRAHRLLAERGLLDHAEVARDGYWPVLKKAMSASGPEDSGTRGPLVPRGHAGLG